MRVALLPDGLLSSAGAPLLDAPDGARRLAFGSADPYYPLGPLAVSPDGRRAWVCDEQGRAIRVELDSGASERFDFVLRDAVYGPDGRVVAVDGAATEPSLIEFDDAAPERHHRRRCPSPQRIHWPYGPPYQFAAYEFDWRGAVRLTATAHGLALAHVSGLLWIRFASGDEQTWTMPPIYQGWTCAYAHADGVVVTSVHNGRTGDVVWLDRQGVWQDAFDSNWKAIGPCVPCRRGFLLGCEDTLLRFEGWPARVCERLQVGGRIEDSAVDPTLERVAVAFDDRVVTLVGDAPTVTLEWSGGHDEEPFVRVAEPSHARPWRFVAVDDPELGRIWRPDPDRTAALIAELRELDEPAAAAAWLSERLPGPALEPGSAIEDLVFTRLRRWITPTLSRAGLTRVVERLADCSDDYQRWALRAALPEPWRALERPTPPAAAWIARHVPILHGGRVDDRTIVAATIEAAIDRRPPWRLRLRCEGGEPIEVSLEGLDPGALAGPPSERSDEFEVVYGELLRDGVAPRAVVVYLDPWPGGFAVRVTVRPREGGDPLLEVGALVEPLALATLDDLRALAHDAPSWPILYVGERDGALHASVFAEDLDDPRVAERPQPRPAIRELIDALVADELLELDAEPDGEFLWAVEVALGKTDDPAAALETLLLNHDAVAELYADRAQLEARLR